MVIVGITGGIGSGKSTITHIFCLLGVPVYIADDESKKLTATSPIIRKNLIKEFGEDLYDGNILNKQLLATYIFNDKNKLEKTNKIIHPEVNRHFKNWLELHKDTPVVGAEAAILFESGMSRLMDKVVMVYTPLEERIKRVMARDGVPYEKVEERIRNQMPDEEKIKLSDYTIYNDETVSLIQQCIDVIDKAERELNVNF